MPELIPTARSMVLNGRNNANLDLETDEVLSQRSHSNETMSLNEDPMNLVETSWDISSSLVNKPASNSNNGAGNSKQLNDNVSTPAKN